MLSLALSLTHILSAHEQSESARVSLSHTHTLSVCVRVCVRLCIKCTHSLTHTCVLNVHTHSLTHTHRYRAQTGGECEAGLHAAAAKTLYRYYHVLSCIVLCYFILCCIILYGLIDMIDGWMDR